jgi:hypothetical protein
MHKVPFVSQAVYAFPRGSCGVASTMMLLKFHYRRKRKPSYRELRKSLGVYLPPSASIRQRAKLGVASDDVTGYLRRQGIRYRTTSRNTRQMWALLTRRLRRAPAMVGMGRNEWRWGKDGHWIVVIDVSEDIVTFLDPGYPPTHPRPSRMALVRFRKQWDGSSVQILGFH